ncbi:5-oxoprolinase subunit B family protein [Agaribacter flavus]|uniref:Allophanate hydrolase subunit 1 n=1 Tax=Agaribacter flavus TaxID=1902781 RepID=A0ABV7FS87_9ALTE
MNIETEAVSENAVLLRVFATDNTSLLAKNQYVSRVFHKVMKNPPDWLVDLSPAYESLLFTYNLLMVDQWQVKNFIREQLASNELEQGIFERQHIRIPVLYASCHEEQPCDLTALEKIHGVPQSEIIKRHLSQSYRVFAVGFLPNFAYMGELPEKLNTPRLSSPRTKVPKGAVAIADRQTAIYPQDSQGGWHILGYTPLNLDLNENRGIGNEISSTIKFNVGDTVEFYAISAKEYACLASPTSTKYSN